MKETKEIKADKGGATLIMNFADIKAAIENELFNTEKFSKLERNAEAQLEYVRNEVRSLAMTLEQRKLISASDKTLITGLNENNRPKLAPEYQPESTNSHTQKLKIVSCSSHWSQLQFLVSCSSFGRCRIKEQRDSDEEDQIII